MKKEELKRCNVCNAYDHKEANEHFNEEELEILDYKELIASELVECAICGKYVCDPENSDACGEILNYDESYCKKCLDKQIKFEINSIK